MLPDSLLGKWILVVAVASVFNTSQCFIDPTATLTKRIYLLQSSQVTPLMARMFGTWTALSAIIRLYGAYNLNNRGVYHITLSTFALALAHFLVEVFVYNTASLDSPGVLSPLVVASSSLAWMLAAYSRFSLSQSIGKSKRQ